MQYNFFANKYGFEQIISKKFVPNMYTFQKKRFSTKYSHP